MKVRVHRAAHAYTPPIVASSKSRGSGNSNSNAKEKIARKYCFKASCTLKDSNHQAVGVFVAYDYRISVVQDVQNACETHAASLNPGVTCGDVQVTLMDECVTEVTDDIYFHFLRDDDSDT